MAAAATRQPLLALDALRRRWTFVSIPFSHYNERARWALDLAQIPYQTAAALPLLHMPVVWWHQRRAQYRALPSRTASRFGTPFMYGVPLDGGDRGAQPVVVRDSDEILALAATTGGPAATLYPDEHREEIEAVSKRCHDELGTAVRVMCYNCVLPSWWTMARIAFHNVGFLQALLFVLLFPLVRFGIRKGLHVNEQRAARMQDRVRAIFVDMEARLAANAAAYKTDKPYLCGPTFTAADLTFASLASLAVGITHAEGYGAWMPQRDEVPPALRRLIDEMRATKAGQHVLRMYREHRPKPGKA